MSKPEKVFQTYNPHIGILTVHETEDPDSPVVFHGKPEDYDGSATEPAAPTAQYIAKHAEEEKAESAPETPNAAPIHGRASDGTVFTAESDAVIAYRQQYPDVTLEAAIGSVVSIYEQQIAQ